jgi:hypothetical protein
MATYRHKMTILEWIAVVLGFLALIWLIPKIVNGQSKTWVHIMDTKPNVRWYGLNASLVSKDNNPILIVKASDDETTIFGEFEFKCGENLFKLTNIGESLNVLEKPSDINWREIKPKTVSEFLYRKACKR